MFRPTDHKRWWQPIRGHVSYPADSPTATSLGPCSSLVTCCPGCCGTTQWWRRQMVRMINQMAHYLQTTFSIEFSWMKNFIEICSLWSYWQYVSIGSGRDLVHNRRQAIAWANVHQYVCYKYVWLYGWLPQNSASIMSRKDTSLHSPVRPKYGMFLVRSVGWAPLQHLINGRCVQSLAIEWLAVMPESVICGRLLLMHYDDVIMDTIASQITILAIVYSIVYSSADHRKHQSSASLAFVWEIHRGPVNSPHKWPVTRKMFPFDDVIMASKIRLAPLSPSVTVWLASSAHSDSPNEFKDVNTYNVYI